MSVDSNIRQLDSPFTLGANVEESLNFSRPQLFICIMGLIIVATSWWYGEIHMGKYVQGSYYDAYHSRR